MNKDEKVDSKEPVLSHKHAAQDSPQGDILIVDDTPANLRLLSQMLIERGYKVRPVLNGTRALAAVQSTPPDLILLDIMMPEMSGYEVCKRLQADEQTRDIPIIFISALGQTENKVMAFAVGGVDYVTKPFRAEEVLARVETHLALRNTQRELAQKNARLEREIAQHVQTQRALQKRNRELASLNRVGQELTITLDPRQAITQTLEAIMEIVGVQDASVWLWDAQEDWLIGQAIVCNQHAKTALRLAPGQGVAGWVVQTGESVIVADARSDPHFFPGIDEQTGFRTSSLLAVPLRVRGKVIGALEAVNKLDKVQEGRLIDFDTGDQALVETLASSAAIAIDNARLVETMHQYTLEVEARNEELDAFAHTAAHDLKNPLAQVVGFADVLKDQHATLSDEELHRYLGTIAKHGRRMSSIIDELLLLSTVRKLEEVDPQPLDMASIMAQVQDRLASIIEEHQAKIILPESWPEALGYGPWIEEVWANYLSNALKYGGQPPRAELGADPLPAEGANGGQIRFWIRDNGPGIPLQDQDRLFTLFTRLDQVRAKGHGLGLSIVQRIVEKLGGQIGVESQPGQGSTFTFTLPDARQRRG